MLRLRETHNALQLPAFLFLVLFLPVVSGMSGFSEKRAILQITKELIQYTVLKIQFRSVKYTTGIRITKNEAMRQQCVDVSNPLQLIVKYRSIIFLLAKILVNIYSEINKT